MSAQLESLDFKLKELRQLWLHVTFKCNLECNHCLFNCSPEKEANELSLQKAQEHIREAVVLGAKEVYVTGGEPLLWSQLTNFLEWYYTEINLPLTILTNGTRIDEGWAQKLAYYSNFGLQLRISLECYTESTNDQCRGVDSFSKAIRGIKLLNKKKIKPWIAYTNKSGGEVSVDQAAALEGDFKSNLGEQGIEIAGLKVISAYDKGRHQGQLSLNCSSHPEEMLDNIQCAYGLAVCADGIASCPILVDVPRSIISESLKYFLDKPVDLSFSYCQSCLTTGTTCGN